MILFVAAIVAGTTGAFAQTNAHFDGSYNYLQVLDAAPTCISARPLSNCTDVDELHPVQGQPYKYIVNTTDATDDVRWFVVNNYDLTSNSTQLATANNQILASTSTYIDPGTGTGSYVLSVTDHGNTYNKDADGSTTAGITFNGTGTEHEIEITWKYFSGLTSANEIILLVAYVVSEDGCTDNMVVYRIIPEPAFTLDVAVLSQSGDSVADRTSTDPYAECVSPIESAIYNPAIGSVDENLTPGDSLIVDYGENWIYFIVNGANYIDSWLPNFFIEYKDAGGAVITSYNQIEASWAYAGDAAGTTGWNTISNWADSTQAAGYESIPVIANASAASAGTVGAGAVPSAGGECIVVRVRVDWGTQYEHDDAIRTLTFEVDGRAYDGTGTSASDGYESAVYADKHDADCDVDYFGGPGHDYIEYDITPRPEVENAITTAGVDVEEKTGEEQ